MSDNQYQQSNTQTKFAVDYVFAVSQAVSPTGTLGPALLNGDSQFMTVQRTTANQTALLAAGQTGVTGCTVVQTTDPFSGCVGGVASVMIVDPTDGTWSVEFGVPTQNADNTWSIPITTFSSGAATDLAVGNAIFVTVRFLNANDSTPVGGI